MAVNYVEILVKSRDEAKPDLEDLRAKLEELKHTVAQARATVDDKDAAVKLDRMQAKLIDLGKRTANPKITVSGAVRAEADIHMVESALDRLNRKQDEITAGAAAAAATGGGAGGGGLLAALGPVGIGAAITAAVAAGPAMAGLGATLGVGGAGILLALKHDKEAANDFKGALGEVEVAGATAFRPVVNQLARFAEQIAPMVAQIFRAAEPGVMAFLNALEPAIKQVIPMITQFVRAFAPFAGQLGKDVGIVLVDMVKGLMYLIPAFRASAQIVHVFADVVGGALAFAGRLVGDLVRIVYDLFTGRWRGAWKAAYDILNYALTGFSNQLSHAGPFFTRWVAGIWNDITSWFGRLPGYMLHIGAAIVDGLIHGIESYAGNLLSTVSRLASDVSGAFAKVLHIGSPSKVFEEHGRNIVQGLINGINGASGGAVTAMRGVGMAGLPRGGYGALGGAGVLQFEFVGNPGGALDHLLWEWLKNNVRVKGGGGKFSVQKALGRTWPQGG